MKEGFFPLHRLFHHGGPEHLLVLTNEGHYGIDQELEGLLFLFRQLLLNLRRSADGPLQVFIIDELVTVIDEEVGARLLHPKTDHLFAIFLQFGDQGREITVTGDNDEGVDVLFGVTEVNGIDAEADVREFFPLMERLGISIRSMAAS